MTQTILVVNDRWNIRKLVSLALETQGFKVVEAEHGQAALTCLENHAIDLVLTGWSMPVMDGRELLEGLHARSGETKMPVVVLSSSPCPEELPSPKVLGIDCWLVGPSRISTVQRVVADLLVDPPTIQAAARTHASAR